MTHQSSVTGRVYRVLQAPLLAIVIVSVFYVAARQRSLAEGEARRIASRFAFEKSSLPELPHIPRTAYREIRNVHPSLKRIAAWVSFVGAGAALGDLDGDGLGNDVVQVDPRVDEVLVFPAPGTNARFSTFALRPENLAYRRETMAPMGTLIGDFNEDGGSDVLVYFWGRSPIVYYRQPLSGDTPAKLSAERFAAVELVEPHETWFTCSAAQADLDGDGHQDLIVGNYSRDGGAVLDSQDTQNPQEMMASFCLAANGGRSRIFRRLPSESKSSRAKFIEVPDALPDDIASQWNFAVGVADLDGDLLPEVLFVQDFGPDRLLHNRSRPGQVALALVEGQRTFTTPRSKSLGHDSFNGMGVDFADMNQDGLLDFFVSNFTCDYGLHESNFMFLSTGKVGEFKAGIAPYWDASESMGVSRSGWGWDARFVDFDNDGELEAVQATGYMKGETNRWPELHELALGNDQMTQHVFMHPPLGPGTEAAGHEQNPFFVKASDGRYYNLANDIENLSAPMLSRAIAIGDVDGDGRQDMVVANQWEPSYFFLNKAPGPGAFLGLHLRLAVDSGLETSDVNAGSPTAGRATMPAYGAQATLRLANNKKIVGQVDGGSGHTGRRAPEIHFGLGDVPPDEQFDVNVKWRGTDGIVREELFHLKHGWHTIVLRTSLPN